MKTLENILACVLLFAAAVVCIVVFPPLWREKAELRAQRDALKAENEKLEAKVAELRRMQEAFRDNPEYVEIVARREGLARADETVFDFSEASPAPATGNAR